MNTLQFSFDHSLVNKDIIIQGYERLNSYRNTLSEVIENQNYESLEASLCVPSDSLQLAQVKNLLDQKDTSQLKYIFVVGIGGSNLGTKAIYDALRGLDDGHRNTGPKMIFVDTVGEKLFEIVKNIASESITKPEEILINIISKSGGTAETVFNGEVLVNIFEQSGMSDIKDRVVVTTNNGSALHQTADREGIAALTMPTMVGGRYSVFTTVGLLPLMAAGFDVEQLLAGATDMRTESIGSENNAALESAVVSAESLKTGVTINNTFVFNPELESIGKWYRQLMGESVGKRKDKDGNEVRTGIIPMVSVGSTDLHSMAQLYFGGPRTILHSFISSDSQTTTHMPNERSFAGLVVDVEGVSNAKLMDAIIGGTQATLVNNQVPFINIKMDAINEYNLGAYLQFRMTEMMYLAELMNVNAFDQPSVEEYKIETKRILSDSK